MKNIILNKRYFLEEQISKGGFCSIYKGFDIYDKYFKNNSKIAIKIPNEEFLNKDDIDAFLYSEYTLLKKISHDSIVKVFDFGIDSLSNKPYLILEYVDGKLLTDIFNMTLSINQKNKIFENLLKSLKYIHSKGIVYGDISPSNIIILGTKTTLIDFGISQYINNDNKYFTFDFNKNNAYNPKYTAPEVLNGNKPSFSSDIYSLASVIYELYTNKSVLEINLGSISSLDLKGIPFYINYWLRKSLNINKRKINNI